MTKLFLAISNHADFIGGGEHSFTDLLSHLQPLWRPVAVFPMLGEVASRIGMNGIDLRLLPLPPIRPWNIHHMIKSINSCAHLCKAVNPKFIYANGSRAAFYGGLAGRRIKLPVVWHCRIADRDPLLDAILYKLSSCVIANSHATATRFKRSLRHTIRVVYNGIDLQWLRDPSVEKPEFIRNDWKVILVVARASREKRHDVILSSFERVAKEDPNSHLLCVGSKDSLDPAWWDLLQERTQQSESKERIHWIGQVEDVRPWYKTAHMLLLASENESFGRVAVEAMACGVPVIATRVGAIPEILREGVDGILVKPGSAEEIHEAVLKLLRNERMRKSLSESGAKRAEQFSLERHVSQMVQVFEETLRNYARHLAR